MFSHDTAGGLFLDQEDALSKNPDNPEAALYSALDQLETFRGPEGSLRLKLCYPELAGGCNEWVQTSNPATRPDMLAVFVNVWQGCKILLIKSPY